MHLCEVYIILRDTAYCPAANMTLVSENLLIAEKLKIKKKLKIKENQRASRMARLFGGKQQSGNYEWTTKQ